MNETSLKDKFHNSKFYLPWKRDLVESKKTMAGYIYLEYQEDFLTPKILRLETNTGKKLLNEFKPESGFKATKRGKIKDFSLEPKSPKIYEKYKNLFDSAKEFMNFTIDIDSYDLWELLKDEYGDFGTRTIFVPLKILENSETS